MLWKVFRRTIFVCILFLRVRGGGEEEGGEIMRGAT